ncbi:MAG: ubiquinone biosynthesis protein [Desulfovibrionales bacterium]|nr:ubiquinone biosynthesis protein [Desulfovibrionales bacterium]
MTALANIARFRQIIFALIRYGFDDVVSRLDLPFKALVSSKPDLKGETGTFARIRLLLEDLGPSFVKLGQMLSLRPDLAPEALTRELRKLQDQVAPIDFKEMRPSIEQSLGRSLEEAFSRFDETPLASASLAQVYSARLRAEDVEVAVKAIRPGSRKTIASDLDILEGIAERLQGRLDVLESYDLPGVVRELRRMLLAELDSRREARNLHIARGNMAGMEGVRIPRPFDAYCGEQVITMELIQGRTLYQLRPEDVANRHLLAKRGLRLALKQILEDGFFHADPHPGNILIGEDGTMVLIDWGMTGRLTKTMRQQLVDLVEAVADNDGERAVEVLLDLTFCDRAMQTRSLERGVLDVIDAYRHFPLKDILIGQMMLELTEVLRENKVNVPPDLAIMIKSLLGAEGTVRLLDPNLNVVDEASPFVRRLVRSRYSPSSLLGSLRRSLSGLLGLHRELPQRMERIINKVERGELTIRFQHENLGGLRQTMENVSNRLALALIIAALFVGSSMLIQSGVGPDILGYPALGVIGYFISGILGLWIVILILRRRKF